MANDNKDLGYILLWRSFFRSKYWRERRPFSKAEAWLDLFSSANYTPQDEIVGNVTVTVGRGEFMASVRFLSERWMWGTATVHRFMGQLKKDGMITTRTPNGTQQTIVIICNYDEYNAMPKKAEHPPEQERNGGETPDGTNINKERSKVTAGNDKEIILSLCNSFRAGARVTADEIRAIYEVFFFRNFIMPAVETENFINHYEADGWVRKSGQRIKNKIALAENWEQRKYSGLRFPVGFLKAWEEMYEILKTEFAGDILFMLTDLYNVTVNEESHHIAVACSMPLSATIEKHSGRLTPVWQSYNPKMKLIWKIKS